MASLLLPVWGMFIVWEKRSRELKVTLSIKGPTAIAQDQSWPLRLEFAHSFCVPLCQQRAPDSRGTVLSFANTKLGASLSGCLLFVKHWLFIYLAAGACSFAGFWEHIALVDLHKFMLPPGWVACSCDRYLSVHHCLASWSYLNY